MATWTCIPIEGDRKTIRVREGVYERLKGRKRPDERFSDLLERLTTRKSGLDQGFGAFADVDYESSLDELVESW
ncbi:antitoxin VapB family protein [Halobacteriales archaeon Cl-PHB]